MLTPHVLNIVIYSTSPSLEYFIKDMLKNRFNAHRDYIVNVSSAKELRRAKMDSFIAPLLCEKWLIHVQTDKLSLKDIGAALKFNTAHGVTVYWVSKYSTYKQILSLDEFKKLGSYCVNFNFSSLGYSDVIYLHDKVLGTRGLSRELLDYVVKNYKYDVQSIFELFTMIRSGSDISTKKDIIEAIGSGLGGNAVGSFTVTLLKAGIRNRFYPLKDKGESSEGFVSERAKRNMLGKALRTLEELSVVYKYDTIRNYMLSTLDSFLAIKQLQIMGVYGKPNKEISEVFDIKPMHRRFDRIILEEVSLPRILNLKLCLQTYNHFNAELALIQGITAYLDTIPVRKNYTA